ncbi:MAG: hypothetical protein HQL93_09600 [Magnetococcales bacterium]|nr:hypothetical protein [Magnetococcales bacterium]
MIDEECDPCNDAKLFHQFTAVKLLDYSKADLQGSINPFAIVTLAHLLAKRAG